MPGLFVLPEGIINEGSAAMFALAAVGALATGCGGGSEAAAPATPTTPTAPATPTATTTATAAPPQTTTTAPTTTTAAAPSRNSRGSLVKRVGEEAGTTDANHTPVLNFTVTSIRTGKTCKPTESDAGKPDNGTFLFVMMDVTTSPTYDPSANSGFFSPFAWQTIGADGVTQSKLTTPQVYGCAESRNGGLPDQLAPGSKYQGTVVLDTSSPTGTLVLRPPSAQGRLGWEWSY